MLLRRRFLFRSVHLERIEHERRRTSDALQARIPRACRRLLPAGRRSLELAEFFGVAPRAVENSIATLGAHCARQHHPWCFCSSPDLYTGAKELSYPACRRLRLDAETFTAL
jgi:hypothetical protein